MSTILTSAEGNNSNFTPHPEGQFMSVCCDVFTTVKPNKYKGTFNDDGKEDKRDTVTSVCLSFLTDETIEINGKMLPRYASYWASATLGSPDRPSNLRKFLKAWVPSLNDAALKTFDADSLVGRGAYITIVHNPKKDGTGVWVNILGAMNPPKGAAIPAIPADFIRHKDKDAAPAPAQIASAKPAHIPDGDDNEPLPF